MSTVAEKSHQASDNIRYITYTQERVSHANKLNGSI